MSLAWAILSPTAVTPNTRPPAVTTFPSVSFVPAWKTTTSANKPKILHNQPVEDTEEYVEESLSLIDAEKEIIIKALERHNGKRKYAAQDLHISERTLYRKIKEYGLE